MRSKEPEDPERRGNLDHAANQLITGPLLADEVDAPLKRVQLFSPRFWLVLLVAAFFAISLSLSVLRLLEFQTGNWDLGIPMQALWSTNHGHPLYEAGDYAQFGAGSWFEVHPSFLAVAIAPLYGVLPSAITLFVLQSGVVAAAAIPLYAIAKDVTGSERRALLTAGVYLVWPPVLSANLFDFHLESFLPLELFTLFFLWRRGRYVLGTLVAILACVTIEVGPVFVAMIALFFLLPPIRATWRDVRSSVKLRVEGSAAKAWWDYGRSRIGPWLRTPRVQAALALGLLSVVAYVLLREVEANPAWVLLAPVAVSGNPAVPPVGVGQLGLLLSRFPLALPQKVGYWLLLYGLVAFLPLRALRTQVIVLPWMVETFFSHSSFTQLGNQYGFLPAVPLMIGFAYGVKDLELAPLTDLAKLFRRSSTRPDAATSSTSDRGARRLGRPVAWTLFLVGVLVACVLISPADPLVQTQASVSGYSVSYHSEPGYAQVQQMVSLLPSGATVLASNDLFPFVANDLHAYALLWTPTVLPYLPFNSSHLPTYVLVSSSQSGDVPAWLSPLLNEAPTYGILGWVYPTEAGEVTLYETGYTGAPQVWNP